MKSPNDEFYSAGSFVPDPSIELPEDALFIEAKQELRDLQDLLNNVYDDLDIYD